MDALHNHLSLYFRLKKDAKYWVLYLNDPIKKYSIICKIFKIKIIYLSTKAFIHIFFMYEKLLSFGKALSSRYLKSYIPYTTHFATTYLHEYNMACQFCQITSSCMLSYLYLWVNSFKILNAIQIPNIGV